MASSYRTLTSDPLRSFKFNVIIPMTISSGAPGVVSPPAAGEARLGFMSMSGLGTSIEPLTYREGGDNLTALPLNSPVLTVNGWKKMGAIEIGDRVIDPYGEESKVVDLSPIVTKDTYEVTLGDGSKAVACYGHLWEVEVIDSNHRSITKIVSTLEMRDLVEAEFPSGIARYQVRVPKTAPMHFDIAPELPLDPWLLGILLSEGDLAGDSVGFATADQEILDRVAALIPPGHYIWTDKENPSKHRISVDGDVPGARNKHGRNLIREALRGLGLLGKHAWDKFVPEPYIWASMEDRLALLQGVMDGDGWVGINGCASFSSSSSVLAEQTRDLIFSLGGRVGPLRHKANRTYVYRGERRDCRDVWEFSGISDFLFVPFTLARKTERFSQSDKTSSQFRRVRSVEFVSEQEVRCLEVSAQSHLFISHDFVPSHNTRKMPGQADFNPITLSRGLFSGDSDNWLWMTNLFTAMYGGGINAINNQAVAGDFRTNVYINVLDHPNNSAQNTSSKYGATYPNQSNIVKLSVKLYSAWIGTLSYSDFDAGGNSVSVEQMTLNYEGFDMQWAGSNYVSNPSSW